ncbi:hypothetical protein DZK27_04505 [Rhodobacteraceae bacterium 63075]|nr:hypothetical protein DZK27_04505 [Rhodobacteraceae bacterium 63075]
MILGLSALMLTGAAGCDRAKSAFSRGGYVEDGVRFKPRVQADKEDRAAFSVSVRSAERAPEAAREGARVEATRYCIKHYGNSDITWEGQSPEDEDIVIAEDGNIYMNGRCSTW